MGMSEREYECISYYSLLFKIEGFQNKLEYDLNIQRQAAFAGYIAPHLDPKKLRNITIDKFWPMPGSGAGKTDNKKISDEKRSRIASNLKRLKTNGEVRT